MIKLPRTLHIEGSRLPHGKADPEAIEFSKLSGQFLVVEEKVDGSGVCLFFDDNLDIQIWHRGTPVTNGEFFRLREWAYWHQEELFNLLENRYSLFGEWMLHKHTVFYDRLPHFFLESDIYDSLNNTWLSTQARNTLLTGHNYIKQVPVLAALKPTSLHQLLSLIGKSTYQSDNWRQELWNICEKYEQPLDKVLKQTDQSELMEGLYIKHEDEHKVLGRYKYVRYSFLETIINSGTHVLNRERIYNSTIGGYNFLL